jgi:hypothetical protein
VSLFGVLRELFGHTGGLRVSIYGVLREMFGHTGGLRVSIYGVLRELFGHEREKGTGDWRTLYEEELRNIIYIYLFI